MEYVGFMSILIKALQIKINYIQSHYYVYI